MNDGDPTNIAVHFQQIGDVASILLVCKYRYIHLCMISPTFTKSDLEYVLLDFFLS